MGRNGCPVVGFVEVTLSAGRTQRSSSKMTLGNSDVQDDYTRVLLTPPGHVSWCMSSSMSHVLRPQIIPDDATHLVLSASGNDLLRLLNEAPGAGGAGTGGSGALADSPKECQVARVGVQVQSQFWAALGRGDWATTYSSHLVSLELLLGPKMSAYTIWLACACVCPC